MAVSPPPQLHGFLRLLRGAERPRPGLRRIALALLVGLSCHGLFALAAFCMIGGMAVGMSHGLGQVPDPWRWPANLLLLAQFPLVHSLLLHRRFRHMLAVIVPGRHGETLSSSTYVVVASLQLTALFLLWTPSGSIWWEAEGAVRVALLLVYGSTWLLLLKATIDAGFEVQSGALGWLSLLRGVRPRYPGMPEHGLFRRLRHPIYAAFILTLWTVPVWTPDQLLLAAMLSAYCLLAPMLKERRYRERYGVAFSEYQERVPYIIPALTPRYHPNSSPGKESLCEDE